MVVTGRSILLSPHEVVTSLALPVEGYPFPKTLTCVGVDAEILHPGPHLQEAKRRVQCGGDGIWVTPTLASQTWTRARNLKIRHERIF